MGQQTQWEKFMEEYDERNYGKCTGHDGMWTVKDYQRDNKIIEKRWERETKSLIACFRNQSSLSSTKNRFYGTPKLEKTFQDSEGKKYFLYLFNEINTEGNFVTGIIINENNYEILGIIKNKTTGKYIPRGCNEDRYEISGDKLIKK